MDQYKLTILVKNDLEEKTRDELLSEIKKNLGSVIKEDLWGSRNLTYPIKHQTQAFYAHFEFETEPKNIPSLDKQIKLNEDIIRYLLIRK
ncbi:30S ribosomal protein S6 [Candidatus Daviesbacteria bacterium]|nr:30S ribosomal protein S6 [Candidatus Daviesbacteria bacterium]